MIKDPSYHRAPLNELTKCTKIETKTILLGRFGMLECGKNFRGTLSSDCDVCKTHDDEKHRLNNCSKFQTTNNFAINNKSNFDLIYSDNLNV